MSQGALNRQQFSQPTLPGFNVKPSDAHRWPRGYTPERMAEVRAAPIEINTPPHAGPWSGPAGPRRVQEVIARSTAPMDNIKPMFNGDQLSIQVGGKVGRNVGGTYSGRRGGLGEIVVLPPANRKVTFPEQALLHEIGHMESNVQHQEGLREDDSSNYATPQQKGREEAFADDYRMNHWRPDPRLARSVPATSDALKNTPGYEHEEVWVGKKGFGKRGHKAYIDARTTPIQKDKARAEWQRKSRGYYQAPLDGNYNGGLAAGNREGVFGTPPVWMKGG